MAVTASHAGQVWRAARSASHTPPREKGLDRVWVEATGLALRLMRRTGTYLAMADRVHAERGTLAGMSDAEIRDRAVQTQRHAARMDRSPELRAAALALAAESATRHLGMNPYRVQLAAAAAILDRNVIEMATGEGKTLVAALTAVPLGWSGRGCHILTVNDYLARRDAEWMSPVFRTCGLSVGTIVQASTHTDRKSAYLRDITYTTNKEVAADYLRDQLSLRRFRDPSILVLDAIADLPHSAGDTLLQRGLEHAIVDEADSILIDEAVTPLIISSPASTQALSRDAAEKAHEIASSLRGGRDYRVDRKHHEIRLTDPGRSLVDSAIAGMHGIWRGRRRAHELVVQALVARELFHRDRQYIVHEGRAVIVDEFTGRPMPDRTWRNGLQEAIEAKEQLEVRPPKDTIARVSFQRFFRTYRHLSGMTGTAREARGELWSIYRLSTVPIPTHRPPNRRRLTTRVCSTSIERWQSVASEVADVHRSGRPILVGTRTVEASEHLSDLLEARGIEHRVLNAVRHDREAEIVAQAGANGSVTIATNMAGRGTDIRLEPAVLGLGGLHVIATEPHLSARIDRQLFGRAARQGDPGSGRLFASMEDDLVARHAPLLARIVRTMGCNGALGPVLIAVAQRRAQRLAVRQRDAVARNDEWIRTGLGFAGPGPQ